jgi:hypothetical protein
VPLLDIPITADGLVVDVEIHVSRSHRRQLWAKSAAVPPSVKLRALINLGAEATSVDPTTIGQLGLPFLHIGIANVPIQGGWMPVARHDAGLTLLNPHPVSIW